MSALYRVGRHQPQNVYRGDEYIGVMFNPADAAAVIASLNADLPAAFAAVQECLAKMEGEEDSVLSVQRGCGWCGRKHWEEVVASVS